MSPTLAIGFLITEPPGKPHMFAYLRPINCKQFLRQDSTLIIFAPSTWPCCWHLVLLKHLSPGRAAKFCRETHPVADTFHWALHAPSHLNPTRTTHLSLVLLSPLYRWRHWGKLSNWPKIKVLFISLLGSLLSNRCRWNSLTLRKLQISSQNWGLSALLAVKQRTMCRYTRTQNLRVPTYLVPERIHKSGSVAKSYPTVVTTWTVAHQAPLSMGFPRTRVLEWVDNPFSRGSSWLRDQTQVSCIVGRLCTYEPPGKSKITP